MAVDAAEEQEGVTLVSDGRDSSQCIGLPAPPTISTFGGSHREHRATTCTAMREAPIFVAQGMLNTLLIRPRGRSPNYDCGEAIRIFVTTRSPRLKSSATTVHYRDRKSRRRRRRQESALPTAEKAWGDDPRAHEPYTGRYVGKFNVS